MSKKKWAIGTVLAAGVGYLTGILTAPKSGKETRKDVKNAVVKARKDAEEALKKAHSEIDRLISKCKEEAKSLTKDKKKDIEHLGSRLSTVNDKVRDAISRLRSGEIDDDEIEKVLESAKNAIKNVRKKSSS